LTVEKAKVKTMHIYKCCYNKIKSQRQSQIHISANIESKSKSKSNDFWKSNITGWCCLIYWLT